MNKSNLCTGLILEGGGMRCVYTAGVLDCFLENGIYIKRCYGVSAGAIGGMNYVAKQKGRTFRTVVNYVNDKNYCSIWSLLTTGNLFGVDMLYNKIPNELDPFDYESFAKSDMELTIALSDMKEGIPYYKKLKDMRKDMVYLQASCALPIVSTIVEIDDKKYLDGGIINSIPLMKSIEDGNYKNIVILTKHREYTKPKEGIITRLIGKIMYRKYPKILKQAMVRYINYNRQLEIVKRQELLGNTIVFCPKEQPIIKRAEKDKEKLTFLYHQGYLDAEERIEEIKRFLSEEDNLQDKA